MGGGRGETATPLLFVSTLAALPHTAHPTHHAHPMCPFRPMRWLVVVASRRRTRSWRNVKGAGGELWLGLVIGLAAAALPAAKSGRRPSRPRRKRLRSSDAGGSDVLRRGGDRDVTAAGCSHPPGGRIHIFHIVGYLNMGKYQTHIKNTNRGPGWVRWRYQDRLRRASASVWRCADTRAHRPAGGESTATTLAPTHTHAP